MADTMPPKRGLRARLGLKSNNKQTTAEPRKRLTKKSMPSLKANENATFGDQHLPGAAKDSAYSLSRQSTNSLDKDDDDIPDMLQDLNMSAPHTFRENPYAAVRLSTNPHAHHLAHARDDLDHSRSSKHSTRPSPRSGSRSGPRHSSQPVRHGAPPRDTRQGYRGHGQRPVSAQAPNFSRPHQEHRDLIDKDTGERKDLTEMMHALTFDDTLGAINEEAYRISLDYDPSRPDGTATLASASPEIWDRVASYLTPLDVGNLSISCRTMYWRLGPRPLEALDLAENWQDRLDFLLPMDSKMPYHLFCFPCSRYHLRTHPGEETLRPASVLNPLFNCPNSTNMLLPPPRMRVTEGRLLPFAFVQLVKRAWLNGPWYGLPVDALSRRYKDPYSDWYHQTRYHIHKNGHLLMRVTSQVFASPGLTQAAKRMLLYARSDYTPYFSVCAHWRDGILMDLCKCALGHIPVPKDNAYTQIRGPGRATGIVSLCNDCRPMRRCPECPTEYLIELKLQEDKDVGMNDPARFKQALIVTRWSDLGDGVSPQAPEWSACVGDNVEYDSFKEVGRRAVSGIFESAFSDTMPGQRILSMNPKKIKRGEEGNGWY